MVATDDIARKNLQEIMRRVNVNVLKKIPETTFAELKALNNWDPEKVKYEWRLEQKRQLSVRETEVQAKLVKKADPPPKPFGTQRQEMLRPLHEKARQMSFLTYVDRKAMADQTGLRWEQIDKTFKQLDKKQPIKPVVGFKWPEPPDYFRRSDLVFHFETLDCILGQIYNEADPKTRQEISEVMNQRPGGWAREDMEKLARERWGISGVEIRSEWFHQVKIYPHLVSTKKPGGLVFSDAEQREALQKLMKRDNVKQREKIPKNTLGELKFVNDWDPERVKYEWEMEKRRQWSRKSEEAKAKNRPSATQAIGARRQEMLKPLHEQARKMSFLTMQDRQLMEAKTGLTWDQSCLS
ncbi:unnamed protein product, partial [Mesorhabditis spiculigera]